MTEAQRVTEALGGRWMGRGGICRCPAHDDKNPSLSVADGCDGRLLLKCHAGCDFTDIVAALRGLGILTGKGHLAPPDPAEIARREAEARAERAKGTARAREIWRETLPIADTLAEAYLRRRGLDGPYHRSLRFHPACRHTSTRHLPADEYQRLKRIEAAERRTLMQFVEGAVQ